MKRTIERSIILAAAMGTIAWLIATRWMYMIIASARAKTTTQ